MMELIGPSRFKVWKKLGMPNSFIKMIRLLLCDASVFVNFNNQTKPLDYIEESVRFAH